MGTLLTPIRQSITITAIPKECLRKLLPILLRIDRTVADFVVIGPGVVVIVRFEGSYFDKNEG
jgi:hypothetical protein